jgi:hypothetical protein
MYPEWDFRLSERIPPGGTDGWREAPTDTLPQCFGYNLIELETPEEGTLTVEVEGATTGSRGSTAIFGAALVRDLGAGVEYVEIDVAGNAGSVDIAEVGAESSIWLVVAAFSDRVIDGETFDYRYRMEIHAPTLAPSPVVQDYINRDRESAGCRATGGSLALAPALVLLVLRRRSR